jgi:hypothetical protein
LLATSTAAVNSALQRARTTLETGDPAGEMTSGACEDSRMLASYLSAFSAYGSSLTPI